MALACNALSFGTHLAPQRSSLVNKKATTITRAMPRAAAASVDESVQLGTAKLPPNVDEARSRASIHTHTFNLS